MTESKAALTCVILELAFASSTAAIALFNEERAPSRLFGRWDSVVMAGRRSDCEKAG